ncbi:hypothetical protein GF362_00845 [Candidatus Dojkabacteria bacterium]|nr:hypothetical protein [Candidatus Dojkabacteria bacterium]
MLNKNISKILIGILFSLLSAILLIISLPPGKYWYCIFIALVPSILAQYRIMPKKFSSLAPAIYNAVWLGVFFIDIFASSGTYMIYLPIILVLVVFLTEKNNVEFHEKTDYKYFVVKESLAWTAVEMIRLFIPIMGSWAFIAYALYRQNGLILPVSIFGILGLGLLIISINFTLGLLAIKIYDYCNRKKEISEIRRSWSVVKYSLIIVGFVLIGWGLLSIVLSQTREQKRTEVKVAAVSINRRTSDGGYDDTPEIQENILNTLIDLTEKAVANGARIVVWPEGALAFDPQVQDTEMLTDLASKNNIYLTTGYIVANEDGTWRNEAVTITPDGKFSGRYGKQHPVLFGGEKNTGLGNYPVIDTPYGKLGVIICYDQDFTDSTRFAVSNGAQILAVPSLDWPEIADRHYAHTVFRALENKVSIIKADGGYDSVIINEYGEILEKNISKIPVTKVVISKISIPQSGTFYTRFGDFIGWIGIASILIFIFIERKVLAKKK